MINETLWDAPKVTYLSERLLKAHKEHRCDCCGHSIVIGHTYRRVVALGEDGLETWKCHLGDCYNWDYTGKAT